jgi:hypothetical protein
MHGLNVHVLPSFPAGVSPIWEVLFRAMCCPVPQKLKAALDEAIGSLARRSDVTTALWERLLAAVVVAPISAEATAVPRYDLTYQLNEIEVGWMDACRMGAALLRL